MESVQKITLGFLTSWVTGGFFLLVGVSSMLPPASPLEMTAACFLCAAILLPPIRQRCFQYTKMSLSTPLRIIAILGALMFIGYNAQNDHMNEISSSAAYQDITKPSSQAEQKEEITYREIVKQRANMTDAQFQLFAREQEGKIMNASGYIEDVRETFGRDYEVWIDMDHPSVSMSTQDVMFRVSTNDAMRVNKDQYISFSGEIHSITSILGKALIRLENTKILSQ